MWNSSWGVSQLQLQKNQFETCETTPYTQDSKYVTLHVWRTDRHFLCSFLVFYDKDFRKDTVNVPLYNETVIKNPTNYRQTFAWHCFIIFRNTFKNATLVKMSKRECRVAEGKWRENNLLVHYEINKEKLHYHPKVWTCRMFLFNINI